MRNGRRISSAGRSSFKKRQIRIGELGTEAGCPKRKTGFTIHRPNFTRSVPTAACTTHSPGAHPEPRDAQQKAPRIQYSTRQIKTVKMHPPPSLYAPHPSNTVRKNIPTPPSAFDSV